MSGHTVRFHRVLRAPPERVYRAFLDPQAMVKWLPPHGFTGRVLEMDARVGGVYRMQFTNFSSGHTHAFGGKYLELVPNEKIVNTDLFDDPNLPGQMITTISLKAVSCGTELEPLPTAEAPRERSRGVRERRAPNPCPRLVIETTSVIPESWRSVSTSCDCKDAVQMAEGWGAATEAAGYG